MRVLKVLFRKSIAHIRGFPDVVSVSEVHKMCIINHGSDFHFPEGILKMIPYILYTPSHGAQYDEIHLKTVLVLFFLITCKSLGYRDSFYSWTVTTL